MIRSQIAVYTLLTVLTSYPVSAMQMTELYAVSPGKKLEINLEAGGSATVRGWDRNNMELEVRASQDELEEYEIEVNESRSGIEITVTKRHSWWDASGHIALNIKVPDRFDVEVQTKGGDISIEDITGSFEGKTMGGDINLRSLKGEIDLATMGGDIEVRDSQLEGRVHTMGGDIELNEVAGDLKSSTMGGDVAYTSGELENSGKPIRISSMGGDLELGFVPHGANVRTMGGDIDIGSAKNYIEAKTMGGDIEIRSIDGWVAASTMGGDVDVRMIGDPTEGDRHVELSSKGGDITLSVPENLPMNVDITLAYTRSGEGHYDIYSDFDLNIEATDKWTSKFGSPRKYIFGKGSLNGGKNRIAIETINGNVRLIKN